MHDKHDAMKELDTLLTYLISHNQDHANEIIELAETALAHGQNTAHADLMRGVEALNISNEHLIRALRNLKGE